MRNWINLILMAVPGLMLIGPVYAEKVKLLIYSEQEKGTGKYMTRVMAGQDFLRMDYGENEKGYVLFDLKKNEIYNVNYYDKSIVVISKVDSKNNFPKINLTQKLMSRAEIQIISPLKLLHMQYFANQERCIDSFSIEGFFPEVAGTMLHFYQLLASEHASVLPTTPAEMLNACDIATHILVPERHWQFGLPIREIFSTGKQRILLDLDPQNEQPPQWHDLPKNFRKITPSQVRGSGLDA